MPVFNGEKFLKEAIDSILNQTYQNLELIIVNDASTDSSVEIIRRYQENDSRIRVFKNEVNMGISETTNRGVEQANGEYIALMDQDDISFLDRLEREQKFLGNHPEISAVGANSITIDTKGNFRKRPDVFTSPGLVRWGLLFRNQIQNSSVLFRRNLFFDYGLRWKNLSPGQDYHFWMETCLNHQIANLSDHLIYHRVHGFNASILLRNNLKESTYTTRSVLLKRTLEEELSEEMNAGLVSLDHIKNTNESVMLSKLIMRWLNWNLQQNILPAERKEITQRTTRKLKNIWHLQNRSVRLLPALFHSLALEKIEFLHKRPFRLSK